MVYKLRIQ